MKISDLKSQSERGSGMSASSMPGVKAVGAAPFVAPAVHVQPQLTVRTLTREESISDKSSSSPEGAKLMDLVVNPTVKKVLMHYQELRLIMRSSK